MGKVAFRPPTLPTCPLFWPSLPHCPEWAPTGGFAVNVNAVTPYIALRWGEGCITKAGPPKGSVWPSATQNCREQFKTVTAEHRTQETEWDCKGRRVQASPVSRTHKDIIQKSIFLDDHKFLFSWKNTKYLQILLKQDISRIFHSCSSTSSLGPAICTVTAV